MARILALDYGGKRTGIAVTDSMQIIATGLTTVPSSDLIIFLKKYFASEVVEKVIIGMPKNLKNEDTHGTNLVVLFMQKFATSFPEMPIETIDERFTSKMATKSILDSGAKKKDRQNKALVDEVSATIILQDYMTSLGY
jgi:putative holliday junction resolvase